MSEQNNTLQVEEVAAVVVDVQPDSAVEAPIPQTKVVEPETKNSVEESSVSDETVAAKPVSEEVAQEKPVESEKVQPDVEKKVESTDNKPADGQENEKVSEEKSVEPASCPVAAPVEKSNGEEHSNQAEVKAVEPVAEETNGVCKRKAENGAEVVEDEKSPKKAKVVDDGDQAPVEETAA